MDRRTFLGALASGGSVALAGCTGQRETLHSVTAEPELSPGEFFHESLRIDAGSKQVNLRYEVTADGPFDVLFFGGQANSREFRDYRRAVAGGDGARGRGDSGSGRRAGANPEPAGRNSARRSGGGRGEPGVRLNPSDWHSVVGARGTGEVNRPLRPGTHHFVVDNTAMGAATPDGPLRPTVDLTVRDFELIPG